MEGLVPEREICIAGMLIGEEFGRIQEKLEVVRVGSWK
jgi:hypothetical protein